MNSQSAQVVRFNNSTVWGNIQAWLQKCSNKSKNTAITYEKALRDYFMWLCGKRLEDLQPEDLNVNGTTLIQYQNLLKEQFKGSTVNTKFGAIRSMYKFFEEDYQQINMGAFNKVDRFDEEEDGESYGEIYYDELLQMMELVKNTYKGEEKSLLIEVAVTTSFRKSSLLNLKWSDIVYNPYSNMYEFPTYIKRNKDIKGLKPEQYERLLKLKERNKEYVFGLATSTIQNMMDKLKEQLNIHPSRNITFHSFKNIAVNFAARELKDIDAAQIQGGHKSYATTKKYYIKANRNSANLPGVQIWEDVDLKKIESLSRDQLLEVIKQTTNGCRREIITLAEKLINS